MTDEFVTVTGAVALSDCGMIDGHAHAWINPPASAPTRLQLDDLGGITRDLQDFRAAGGWGLVDCQPGGCGRDANRLRKISQQSGVRIAAATGFHMQQYYPPDDWLWQAKPDAAAAHFVEELTVGMRETGGTIPATVIKVGYSGSGADQEAALMHAAAEAAYQTGAGILFHTERGRGTETLPSFFAARGVSPSRLYICHIDKRPDFGLHFALAQAGCLLGYDTFVRPQYDPEHHVWPLLLRMVAAGLAGQVAVCLDLALANLWRFQGHADGMRFLTDHILPRLRAEGLDAETIAQLMGGSVARFLVRRPPAASA
jgi:phosphotriesterase-related protein